MVSITACGKCGFNLSEGMMFCPACGRRVYARSKWFYARVGAISALIFGVAFALQLGVRGQRQAPSPARSTVAEGGSVANHPEHPVVDESPQLVAMRKQVEEAPGDLTKLKLFAGMLGDTLRGKPEASQSLVFEAIDVLSRILQAEPQDPGALVMMADLSFDQKAFTKALDFYERYLKLEGDDLGARSRYASTLTFLGRYDDSIKELGAVLQVDPKNFPAMAYLAITHAQKGDIATAKQVGGDALKLAPSEDARARFASFVTSLDGVSSSASSVNAAASSPLQVTNASGIDAFIAGVRANPVAGPKFVSFDPIKDGELKLLFKDFPMAQMPPFAKEKFFGGLKASIAQFGLSNVSALVFVDAGSGAVMERVGVPG